MLDSIRIEPASGRPSRFILTETTTVVLSASVESEPTFQQFDTATRNASFSPAVSGGPLGAGSGDAAPPPSASASAALTADCASGAFSAGFGSRLATLAGRARGRSEALGATSSPLSASVMMRSVAASGAVCSFGACRVSPPSSGVTAGEVTSSGRASGGGGATGCGATRSTARDSGLDGTGSGVSTATSCSG
ncbi:hypothetical protein ACFOHS_12740 [Jhaorihella thermophila]